jgi:putative ABC transport system permease protein
VSQDIRHAIRTLAHAPSFTTAALATLALGIGATSIVFSLVNGLLLRPLPFGEGSTRIVSLHGTHPTQFPEDWDDAGVSYPDLLDVRRESRLLAGVGAYLEHDVTLYGEESIRAAACAVTPGLFDLLNVTPALGRGFRTDDGARWGFATAVILSDALWQSRFGGDPEIIGRQILINEREHTVIGVMPKGFRFPERADLWDPFDPGEGGNRAARGLRALAKLSEDTTLTQSRLELEAIAQRLASRYPDTNRSWGIHAVAYRNLVVKSATRVVVTALLVAVALVLVIGCANLSSLLLARGTARQRELAVRSAIGAGRGQLVRQMFAESLLLGFAGGALGTLVAWWGIDAVVASFPEELPYWLSFELDWRVMSFIVALSVSTSIAFGLLPAVRASQVNITSALGSGRDPASGRRASELQGALIVGQVALSLALLVGAALMVKSFMNLYEADPGFDGSSLLTMRIYLAGDEYDPTSAKVAFFRDAADRVRAVPGVAAATATLSIPTDDGGQAARVVTPEHPVADGTEIGVHVISSTPGFFETLGISMVEGRAIQDRDLGENAPPVAIVNEALATRLWPKATAVGRDIGLVTSRGIDWLRIIGVAPHIQYEEFGEDTAQSQLNVFVPYSRIPARGMAFLVRAQSDPGELAAPVRDALRSFAPGAPLFLVRTMDEVRYMTTWEQRFFSYVFGLFAASAVLLACLGVYGLVWYRSSQRTHEIGIRVALGADQRAVLRLLLGQGASLAAAGLGAGLVLSLGVSRMLKSVVFGTPPGAIGLFAAMACILATSVLVASYLPARRAARIRPMAALRQD